MLLWRSTGHGTYTHRLPCGLTEDAIEAALTAVEGIRGEATAATLEGGLTAFREMGYEMSVNAR